MYNCHCEHPCIRKGCFSFFSRHIRKIRYLKISENLIKIIKSRNREIVTKIMSELFSGIQSEIKSCAFHITEEVRDKVGFQF